MQDHLVRHYHNQVNLTNTLQALPDGHICAHPISANFTQKKKIYSADQLVLGWKWGEGGAGLLTTHLKNMLNKLRSCLVFSPEINGGT